MEYWIKNELQPHESYKYCRCYSHEFARDIYYKCSYARIQKVAHFQNSESTLDNEEDSRMFPCIASVRVVKQCPDSVDVSNGC